MSAPSDTVLICVDPVSEKTLMPVQADDANAEMLELLADFLPKRFPDRFTMEGTVLTNHELGDQWDLADKSLDPLEVSAQLVQVCCSSARQQVTP